MSSSKIGSTTSTVGKTSLSLSQSPSVGIQGSIILLSSSIAIDVLLLIACKSSSPFHLPPRLDLIASAVTIVYILDTSPASTSVSPVVGSVIVPVDLNLIEAPGDNNPLGVKRPSSPVPLL